MQRERAGDGFNSTVYATLAEGIERARAAGRSSEEIEKIISELMGAAIDSTTPIWTDGLFKSTPSMLRAHRRRHRKFERKLRKHWGRGLDLYYAVVVAAEEAGGTYLSEVDEDDEELNLTLIESLAGLHARACRTALEVFHLCKVGLAQGALARSRTLHELAVTSAVLADYGGRPEYADLAERYLLHDVVINYKDMIVFQEKAHQIGEEKLADEEVAEITRERNELRDLYGSAYCGDNGWAAVLFGDRNPKFHELEEIANLAHLRGHYKWASHEVHADSKGWRLNSEDRDGRLYLETGYAGVGLADPASLALNSLINTTIALLFSSGNPEPFTLVAAKVIMELSGEAQSELLRGHESAEAFDERFRIAQRALRGADQDCSSE
ncbi:DUF5677 domain-containing protein [Lentzea sp. HUAS TT2]|uniref:DUF5677 domain-containing protein n=1 Tax=Lentzea sp. HUAS TT2 TaxID=3447454 RepID=UPI003F6E5C47